LDKRDVNSFGRAEQPEISYFVSAEFNRHVDVLDVDENPRAYAVTIESFQVGSHTFGGGEGKRALRACSSHKGVSKRIMHNVRYEIHSTTSIEF
jgi:hypothetical protein